MTDRADIPVPGGIRSDVLVAVGIILVAVVALALFMSQRQQVLRASPTGLDGLQVWLQSKEFDVQSHTGGWGVEADSIGLLVIPIYDTLLLQDRVPPKNKVEFLLQQDEFDLKIGNILKKRKRVPTLLVLPKWRSGVRLARIAHPELLSDTIRIRQVLAQVSTKAAIDIHYAPKAFSRFEYPDRDGHVLRGELYAAQMFSGDGCAPLIGTDTRMVLGRCTIGDDIPFYVLSDPDLINNHGLRLGDNALIAADFATVAGKKQIMIDYSPSYWLFDTEEFERPELSWADLFQFFRYPFVMLWLGAAFALALAIWRGGRRFGPLQRERDTQGRSKMLAIAARARLMRRTRHNGALAREFAEVRLAAVAARHLGPALGHDPERALVHLGRIAPEPTRRLAATLAHIRTLPDRAEPASTATLIDEFEFHLKEIEHAT